MTRNVLAPQLGTHKMAAMAERKPQAYLFSIPDPVQWVAYALIRLFLRLIMLCTVRVRLYRRFPAGLDRGCLLACNHGSHLDAHMISILLSRKVDWISRIEFFRQPLSAFFLQLCSAIPVHRQGVALSTIKEAIHRVQSGRTVGICPEGEVRNGPDSVLRGGKLKRGVGFIAVRTGAPVVPCVVLGVEAFRKVDPWLPARRGQLWFNFGPPIRPRLDLPHKEARERLAVELEKELRRLAGELLENYSIPENMRP